MAATPPQAAPAKQALSVGHDVREIGHLAVWTVTSAKPGNGVELLRDGSEDTYWQSDGTQPHLVDIQFQKKVHIQVRGPPLGRPRLPRRLSSSQRGLAGAGERERRPRLRARLSSPHSACWPLE